MKTKLSKKMTLLEFEHGYWYAKDLKEFAKEIGIPLYSKLRKDELESIIKKYLKTGELSVPTKRNLKSSTQKDFEKGLSLDQEVIHYTSNKTTKDFILSEAKKIDPNFKIKSGTRYLLNRWREDQISKSIKITYNDLVHKIMELAQSQQSPLRIEHARYNNFISDFMKNKAGSHQEAVKAWNEIKKINAPKTYTSWLKNIK